MPHRSVLENMPWWLYSKRQELAQLVMPHHHPSVWVNLPNWLSSRTKSNRSKEKTWTIFRKSMVEILPETVLKKDLCLVRRMKVDIILQTKLVRMNSSSQVVQFWDQCLANQTTVDTLQQPKLQELDLLHTLSRLSNTTIRHLSKLSDKRHALQAKWLPKQLWLEQPISQNSVEILNWPITLMKMTMWPQLTKAQLNVAHSSLNFQRVVSLWWLRRTKSIASISPMTKMMSTFDFDRITQISN